MNLKVSKITEEVYAVADEVCSLEFEECGYYKRSGTTITLKNGRKIYVNGMTPAQVLERLSKPAGEEK